MADGDDRFVGDLEVRPREQVVVVRGHEVQLSSREFAILGMLAEHPGWVFSASQLAGDSEDGDYSSESVSVLVSRIRHELAIAGATDVVQTVRGVGYRLHPERSDQGESSESAAAGRELRDASWQLQEAVIEVEHSGNAEQRRTAASVLEDARRAIFSTLAE